MRTIQDRANPITFTSPGASSGAGGIGRRGQRNPRRCRQGRGLRFQFHVLRNQTPQSNLNHHHGNFGHGMTRGISQSSRMYFELRRKYSTKSDSTSKNIAIPPRENPMAKFHPHINSSQIQTENHLQSGFNLTHFVSLHGSQNPNPNPTPSQVSTHLTTIYENDDATKTEDILAPVQTGTDADRKMTLENKITVPVDSCANIHKVVLESEIIQRLHNFRIN